MVGRARAGANSHASPRREQQKPAGEIIRLLRSQHVAPDLRSVHLFLDLAGDTTLGPYSLQPHGSTSFVTPAFCHPLTGPRRSILVGALHYLYPAIANPKPPNSISYFDSRVGGSVPHPRRARHWLRIFRRRSAPTVASASASSIEAGRICAGTCAQQKKWRRGRDSNPRSSCPDTAFPVPRPRPD